MKKFAVIQSQTEIIRHLFGQVATNRLVLPITRHQPCPCLSSSAAFKIVF